MFTLAPQRLPVSLRLIAIVAGALVLWLSLMAARRDWHENLCHHHHPVSACGHNHHGAPDPAGGDTTEAGCVITLFAQGHLLAVLCVLLLLGVSRFCVQLFRFDDRFALPPRVFLLPQSCGPPSV